MKAVVFLLFVAIALVSAQQTVVRYSIDDFSVEQGQSVSLTLPNNLATSDPPVIQSSSRFSAGCSGIIGCARDMIVEARSGGVGRVFASNIFPYDDRFDFVGEWSVSNPKTTSSVMTLQYDGNDNSRNLDLNGLRNFDLTNGGLAQSFRFSIVADLGSSFVIDLYSPNGNVCERTVRPVEILGDNYPVTDTLVDVQFSSFQGNCDLRNIGAVEFSLVSADAVDALVRTFVVIGLPDPVTPTRTPSPSRIPQPSETRTPAPSQSQTPSPSPSASIVPGFTWYTFDDDDNGRSPCDDERPRRTYWVSDDNVIYYYFFGAAHDNVAVDDDGSASSGSVLAAGLSLLATALFI